MASISDLIKQQVAASAGNLNIPSNLKNQVLGGLSESIFGSLAQTASKAGGIEQIKSLLTGKSAASSSPITALAGKLFSSNIVNKLGLSSTLASSVSGIIPVVMTKLSGIIKDQDGDGDIDLNDILIGLKGGSSAGSSLLGAAGSILGSFLKK